MLTASYLSVSSGYGVSIQHETGVHIVNDFLLGGSRLIFGYGFGYARRTFLAGL